jgi:hypothetical protein
MGRFARDQTQHQVEAGLNEMGSTMREINIKLFRNEELHDWSMEINGRFHEHISNEGLTDLVEGSLIVAAKSLIQSSVNGRALQNRATSRPRPVAASL